MNDNVNKLFEENIKNNIKSRNYSECISLLKQKIISIFEFKISKYIPNFKYTCLEDLLDIGAPALPSEEAFILNEYYLIVRRDSASEIKVYKLLEIYKKIKT